MADETKYTFEYNDAAVSVEKIEAGITRMTGATEKATQSISSFAESLGAIRATLEQIQDMDLIPDRSVTNLNRAAMSVEDFRKHLDKSQKGLNQINLTMTQLLHIMKNQNKALDGQARKHDEINKKMTGPFKGARRWAKTMGEDPWEGITQAVAKANSMQRAVTGIDVSIGGIIALLVEAYNEGRKIHGLAMQAAGRIGGMPHAIGLTTRAMGDLRANFRMTNEQAGEIVTSLTDMGFHSQKLAGRTILGGAGEIARVGKELEKAQGHLAEIVRDERKHAAESAKGKVDYKYAGRGGYAVVDRTVAKQVELNGHTASYEDQLTTINDIKAKKEELDKRGIAYAQQEIGIATELSAIQYKYGIAVQKSGGFVKQLQMEYGQTEDAARGMLGSVISSAEALQKETGKALGISEVLADYETLIQYNKVYRTDLHSVLGLYNTLVKASGSHKDNIAGMQGMSKSIALNMAQGLMAAPMKMGIGWKAKFGQGQSAAGRAIEFENLFTEQGMKKGGLGEAFKRIMGGVSDMTSGTSDAATKEIKTRELLTNLGVFNEETVRDLSKRMGTGVLQKADFEKIAGTMLKEQREAEKNEQTWKKDRGKLAAYGGNIARDTQSIAELVKKWAIDNLIGPVNRMVELLEQIAAFFGSSNAAQSIALREQKDKLKAIGISDTGQSMATLQANAAALVDPKTVEDAVTSKVSKWFAVGERADVQKAMSQVKVGFNDPNYSRELFRALPSTLTEKGKRISPEDLRQVVSTTLVEQTNDAIEAGLSRIGALPPDAQEALTLSVRKGMEARDAGVQKRTITTLFEIMKGTKDLADLVDVSPDVLAQDTLDFLTGKYTKNMTIQKR